MVQHLRCLRFLYIAYIFLLSDTSIFQIIVILEKPRLEFLFIINAACIIDGITAETTFVFVFKA